MPGWARRKAFGFGTQKGLGMESQEGISRKSQILMGIHETSMSISMTAMTIVATLEVFMLGYSVVNSPMYGEHLWKYRSFYIVLLCMALAYIALYLFVKRDMAHRFRLLNIANPVCAGFFYAWALGITYLDYFLWGTVDSMVFMTFSLTVPMSFFLFPSAYAVIVVVADALMLYLTAIASSTPAPLINISIFFIFQIVLGVSFLRLKVKLGERIVDEQKNADMDALTGFWNRRVYDQDMKRYLEESVPNDFVYVSIDLNGLKDANDHFGHEAGDRLLIGAAQCISQCFGEKGKLYRIGGDEFVALVNASRDELEEILRDYGTCLESWSARNNLVLSTASGYAAHADYPNDAVDKLARMADEKMYASKARYYQTQGHDRRHRLATEE